MWLPEKFYELLPYLYAILGMATLGYFDTPLGYGSGLLLFTYCLLSLDDEKGLPPRKA